MQPSQSGPRVKLIAHPCSKAVFWGGVDDVNKASLCYVLRDRWKKLRTVLVYQNTLGHAPALYTSSFDRSFDRKRKFAVVSRVAK